MTVREYIGARYVPVFDGYWDATKNYEPLTMVISNQEATAGNSYMSKTFVPAGMTLTNSTYWVLTGEYDAQIASIRYDLDVQAEEIDDIQQDISDIQSDITDIITTEEISLSDFIESYLHTNEFSINQDYSSIKRYGNVFMCILAIEYESDLAVDTPRSIARINPNYSIPYNNHFLNVYGSTNRDGLFYEFERQSNNVGMILSVHNKTDAPIQATSLNIVSFTYII